MSTPPEFPNATEFRAAATLSSQDGIAGVAEVTFAIDDTIYEYNNYPQISPQRLADHISNLYESEGWPPLTFKGRPAEVPVN